MILLVASAQAAGYYASEGGIRATGRAGAFVAGADDLSAQTYNPAALSRIDRQLTFQLAGVHQQVVFDRADEDELSFDPVRNGAAPMPIPALGFAFSPLSRLTLAIGAYTPYAPRFAFPDAGPQRFTLVDSVVLSGNVGPSAAWSFRDLHVGAGVAWTFVSVEQSLVSHVAPLQFAPEDNPDYDVAVSLDLLDPFEITWNAGLLYDRERFAVGLSYTPPVHFEPTGTLTADFSRNTYYVGDKDLGKIIANPTATDGDVGLEVVLPRVVRAGVLLRPHPRVDVEADLVWEQWSSMPTLEVQDLDLVIETEMAEDVLLDGTVSLPGEMQDAWALRVGGQFEATPRFDVRAGLSYETSAVAPEYRSVFLPDGNEIGYGLGGSLGINDVLALDLAWSQAFVPGHELDPSWVYQVQIDPSSGEVGAGKRVGGGTFRSTTSMFGLGLNWTPQREDPT